MGCLKTWQTSQDLAARDQTKLRAQKKIDEIELVFFCRDNLELYIHRDLLDSYLFRRLRRKLCYALNKCVVGRIAANSFLFCDSVEFNLREPALEGWWAFLMNVGWKIMLFCFLKFFDVFFTYFRPKMALLWFFYVYIGRPRTSFHHVWAHLKKIPLPSQMTEERTLGRVLESNLGPLALQATALLT